jgi:hypothetical protein
VRSRPCSQLLAVRSYQEENNDHSANHQAVAKSERGMLADRAVRGKTIYKHSEHLGASRCCRSEDHSDLTPIAEANPACSREINQLFSEATPINALQGDDPDAFHLR